MADEKSNTQQGQLTRCDPISVFQTSLFFFVFAL
jgi:hypothetical protein